ncbi:MAG: ABC transporter ATP-binding protein [Actinomycetota bacterium]
MARDAGRFGALGIVVAVSSALALAGPLLLAEIVDRVTVGGATTGELAPLGGAYLGVSIANLVASIAVSHLATIAAWRTANRLRMELAAHVLGLDHEFHRSRSPGELIERIDGDVTSVSDFLALVVVKLIGAVLLIGGIIVVLGLVEWWLGLALLLYVAAVLVGVVRRRDEAVAESMEELGASAALYGGIEERLTAAEDLRANGAGAYALARFVADTGRYVGVAVERERAFIRLWRSLQVSIVAGKVLALVGGAVAVGAGIMTVGSAFLLFRYVQLLQGPLEDISNDLELVQKANGAMARVGRLLAMRSRVPDDGAIEPPAGAMAVEVDGVGFHYGDGEQILADIDLAFEAGTTVGLVGATGSGKTTLTRLLVRLVDATDGAVRLGGVDIREIPMSHLRERVAVIGQNVDLVSGTIADNLTLFRPDVDEGAIDDALRQVGLDRFAGRSTEVWLGPGGQGLSAGESQLLALARVWLRRPDVIVLDEPTARVDPETEGRIEAAVADLVAGRTVVIVAHRLSTLQRVDEIVVMADGRVVEHGRRAALAADPASRFARLLAAGMEADLALAAGRPPGVGRGPVDDGTEVPS